MITVRIDTLEELAAIVAVIRGEEASASQIREQLARLNDAANRLDDAQKGAT